MKNKPRAYLSGRLLARAIIEMVHLMYQNNTARNFLEGLRSGIEAEQRKRLRK